MRLVSVVLGARSRRHLCVLPSVGFGLNSIATLNNPLQEVSHSSLICEARGNMGPQNAAV